MNEMPITKATPDTLQIYFINKSNKNLRIARVWRSIRCVCVCDLEVGQFHFEQNWIHFDFATNFSSRTNQLITHELSACNLFFFRFRNQQLRTKCKMMIILKSIPEMTHFFSSPSANILETLELLRQIFTDSKINHAKSRRKFSTTVVRSIVPHSL